MPKSRRRTFIELDDKRINALLGTDIPREFMADTLTSLGFELNGNTLTVPSWRGDCTMLADIAEECARFWGYDKIEATDIRGAATQGGYSEKTLFVRKLGTACRAMGYTEVMTYSFVSPSSLDKIKVPADSPLRDNYRILNPLGEDTSVMRTTALPSMLGVLSTNLSRRNMEAKLYEMATVYKKQPGKVLADERTVLTLGAYGGDVDFFALKGAVEALLCAARTPDVRFTADTETAAFHPGRCAAVWSGDTRLGTLGQIHPDVCAAYGLNGATYCAEIDVVLLHDLEGAEPVYHAAAALPGHHARHRRRVRRRRSRRRADRVHPQGGKERPARREALRRLHRRRYPGREEERRLLADAPLGRRYAHRRSRRGSRPRGARRAARELRRCHPVRFSLKLARRCGMVITERNF